MRPAMRDGKYGPLMVPVRSRLKLQEAPDDLRPPRMWWESRALWRAGGRAREREWIAWVRMVERAYVVEQIKVQISPIPLPKGGQINR